MPRAAYYDQFGPVSNLKVGEVSSLPMGPDTVALDVAGAGINPVDYKIQAGSMAAAIESHFPIVPGWDVAGVVTAVGPAVPEFVPGDRVYGYARMDTVQHGTAAEAVVLPVRLLAKAPTSLDLVTAGAVPLAGLTALQVLRRLEVQPGDNVLVHNAAGGVGQFAVQLAKYWGAHVVGTASEANHAHLRSLGIEPVAYGAGLAESAHPLLPDGADVVVDLVGGGALESSDALLAPGARVGSIADGKGAVERGGKYVFVRPSPSDLTELAQIIDAGAIQVDIAATYPLQDAAAAYEQL